VALALTVDADTLGDACLLLDPQAAENTIKAVAPRIAEIRFLVRQMIIVITPSRRSFELINAAQACGVPVVSRYILR